MTDPRLKQVKEKQYSMIGSGSNLMPALQEGSGIGSILSGASDISNIMAARTQAAGDYMAKAGINGANRLNAASGLSQQQKMGIEQELNRRRGAIVSGGINAMGAQAQDANMANARQHQDTMAGYARSNARATRNLNAIGSIAGLAGQAAGAGMFSGFGGSAPSGSNAAGYSNDIMANWSRGQ